MSEAQLQDAVAEMARALGWRVFHARPARTQKGWRTPVAYDGKGFVDLVMLRGPRGIASELKSAKGRVEPEQDEWLGAFALAGFTAHVWRPADWLDGTIEQALR